MKKIFLIVLLASLGWIIYSMSFYDPWLTDFEMAKKESMESGKPILLYFSGSDWCGACMKTKKEILETETFKQYADDNLVLMVSDFPRTKKNMPDEKTIKQNETLAGQYNPSGGFPYLVLLSQDLKILKEWKGYPDVKPEVFIDQIKRCKRSL